MTYGTSGSRTTFTLLGKQVGNHVFTVEMFNCHRSGMTIQSTFKFSDLAGIEQMNSTGTTGQRLKKAKNMNTSLITLGRCLDAASTALRKRHADLIPYRYYMLTMLPQADLLGKKKLAMIVTVTPVYNSFDNHNVLNLASIPKNIVFKEPLIKQHPIPYTGFMEFPKTAPEGGTIWGRKR